MTMTDPKPTTQYHAQLTNPINQNLCLFQGQDNEDVQDDIKKVLGQQNVTFREQDTYTVWIFHRELPKPVGQINKITVSEELSVQTVTEHTLQLLKTEPRRQAV